MQVNIAGFTSLYEGTPYVFTISWKGKVNAFVLNKLGGFTV